MRSHRLLSRGSPPFLYGIVFLLFVRRGLSIPVSAVASSLLMTALVFGVQVLQEMDRQGKSWTEVLSVRSWSKDHQDVLKFAVALSLVATCLLLIAAWMTGKFW